jgi:hypothetical protein
MVGEETSRRKKGREDEQKRLGISLRVLAGETANSGGGVTPEDLENAFYKACSEEHKKYVLEWTKPVNQRKVVEAGWKAVLELCERELKK